MLQEKLIFCANCGRQIGSWDGKSTINKIIRCRCGNYNLYKVDTGKTEIVNKPERICGSGMTFH